MDKAVNVLKSNLQFHHCEKKSRVNCFAQKTSKLKSESAVSSKYGAEFTSIPFFPGLRYGFLWMSSHSVRGRRDCGTKSGKRDSYERMWTTEVS